MSNKQSMKLYTEEQVRTAIRDAYWCCSKLEVECVFDKLTPIELPSDSLCINCDKSESTHNICMDCIIKIGKENIQLPSDEEIESKYNKFIDTEIQLGFLKQEQGERLKWYYKTYFINNEQK